MEIKELEKEWLIPFYDRFNITIKKGKKHYVFDEKGKKYLDFASGIAVVNFGHANRKINNAIKKQIDSITHASNLYYNKLQIELAKKISEKSFKAKVFFCNSGAEANEAAIKVARLYGNSKKAGKNKIIALYNSFHGRTIATISMTGQEKYKKGFEPLLENFIFIEANNVKQLEENFNEEICAIFLEAIQGEGGINKLTDNFVKKARELATKFDALLIFDEVQTGIGRTGKYFGYQNFDILPDGFTLAKGLGNGVPIGAFVVKPEIADMMKSGLHASTFGGNFLACASALKVLDMLDEKILKKINYLSEIFKMELEKIKQKFPKIIKEIRIYGLMIGIELSDKLEVKDIINKFISKNILTLRAGQNVLRLLPPFTIGEKEILDFCNVFEDILKDGEVL
ncbi:MAG: aspartate aminotransferase family protein [Brevinematales bacterium]|nr:aspartate aminotransferase family protein [Brevinematales bacterium]